MNGEHSTKTSRVAASAQLVASPFLAQYLLVQPGQTAGVCIPEARYEELRTASTKGRPVPAWMADAAKKAWGTELPSVPVGDVVLVRERSQYG
jgi:hypothetical protein